MKNLQFILTAIALLFAAACAPKEETGEATLKSAYKDKFYIGVALDSFQIYQLDSLADRLIKTQFNSIVNENCMKPEKIHPEPGVYFWDDADTYVKFGEDNDMFIVGHCLAWHSQTPDWFFKDEKGREVPRDTLIERLRDHITTVMTRYKGRIDGWDVVNEAVGDDGGMRESLYYKIIGPDWVELAFRFAQEADPEAELYYNDYSMANPVKREAAYALVKDLQGKGIKVTGIGMQGHVGMDYPSYEDFEASIVRFAELGDVMITEMDITVLPFPQERVTAEVSLTSEYQEKFNPYAGGLPDSVSVALNNRYVEFFKIFNKHADKITRVTLWGLTDAQSWRNNWPIRGRTDFPLLFDRNYQPKPAVAEIIKLAGAEKQ